MGKSDAYQFPVKHTAYPLFEDFKRLESGEVVYGSGAYCENSIENPSYFAAERRLPHFWETAIFLKLGPQKNVNASRILFIYNEGRNRCVYPAEEFKSENRWQAARTVDEVKKRYDDLFKDPIESIYIERNKRYLYGDENDSREYTTYWVPMMSRKGSFLGAIGIQILETEFQKLIPSAVLEEPYQVSFVAVYDKDKQLSWSYTNSMSEAEK